MATRRHFSSTANNAATKLAGACFVASAADASQVTISVDSATYTGFPSAYPYPLVLDPDTSSEELVDVTAAVNAGSTYTLTVTRGVDGTIGKSHALNAVISHRVSARDFDEANALTVRAPSGSANLVDLSTAQSLTNKTISGGTLSGVLLDTINMTGTSVLSAPILHGATLTGSSLDAASSLGGVTVTQFLADRAAWTAYTPTFGNITGGAGNFAYKLIGKNLHLRAEFTAGTTPSGSPSFTIPATGIVNTNGQGAMFVSGTGALVPVRLLSNSNTIVFSLGGVTITSGYLLNTVFEVQ